MDKAAGTPAGTAKFDQALAEASDVLAQLIASYQAARGDYSDEENLKLITSAIADELTPDVAATLLAVAVRRLASPHGGSEGDPCGDFPAPCNCDDPATHNGH